MSYITSSKIVECQDRVRFRRETFPQDTFGLLLLLGEHCNWFIPHSFVSLEENEEGGTF